MNGNGFSEIMGAPDEAEVFLSLEDEESEDAPLVAVPSPVLVAQPSSETPNITTGEEEGAFSVSWPLIGMDCPDCAAKATRAMSQLQQVTNSTVSVTSGEVKVNVDLKIGPLFEVSSVLRSLGHAPDVEHHELVGVKASSVAQRCEIPVQRLDRVVRTLPGVLDAEVSDDGRILVQLVVTNDEDLLGARKTAFEEVLGKSPEFAEAKSDRLRPDQWRLIGGGIAVPVLLFVMVAEFLGYHGFLIPLVAIPGVAIGGIQMFKEAFGSLKRLQMGFQVLTSLAVIGACILGMWEEALIVTILVAFTIHLESDALIKAREAMQGGLDRLPRTARKLHEHPELTVESMSSFSVAPAGLTPGLAAGPGLNAICLLYTSPSPRD